MFGWDDLIKSGVGALIGGGSALMGGGGFSGKKPRLNRISPYSQEGQGGLDWLVQQGRQNADFGNIENRARQQFRQNTIPSIAERFTSLGSGGAQESSAFGNELGGAAVDLESQLGALRSQFGLQQMQAGLRPQFDFIQEEGKPGFLQGALGGAVEGLGGSGGIMKGLEGLFGNNQDESQGTSQNQKIIDLLKSPEGNSILMRLLTSVRGGQGVQGGRL